MKSRLAGRRGDIISPQDGGRLEGPHLRLDRRSPFTDPRVCGAARRTIELQTIELQAIELQI
ncbi:hypothetical protein EYF80_057239 [Liparis tanakae]|uniref:Uncharacterized protein n=1 Tax=Liparis tanakae TaxID=230148 RepID=A0A4Z2EUU7_9TELE|nr:hypothetical protein EYF80_057239 [Liparis tanakae]